MKEYLFIASAIMGPTSESETYDYEVRWDPLQRDQHRIEVKSPYHAITEEPLRPKEEKNITYAEAIQWEHDRLERKKLRQAMDVIPNNVYNKITRQY